MFQYCGLFLIVPRLGFMNLSNGALDFETTLKDSSTFARKLYACVCNIVHAHLMILSHNDPGE